MTSLSKFGLLILLCFGLAQSAFAQDDTDTSEDAKLLNGFILKWRAHYPIIAAGAGFQRWYFQTESRIKNSHHGIGLHGDYITSSGVFKEEDSEMNSWGAGLAYRFVAKKEYFANSFYVHSALIFRGFDFEHTDATLGVGTLNTNAINIFINPGYQWFFVKNRLQVAVGFGVDASFLFDDELDFNGTKRTFSDIDENDGAPFFPVAPDFDVTIGWKF